MFNQNTTKNSTFYWNEIKHQDWICGLSKTKSTVSVTKYLHLLSYSQNCVFKNQYPFPRTPIFEQSPSHYQHDSKLKKNSKFKSPMSNGQSLSLTLCSSKTM